MVHPYLLCHPLLLLSSVRPNTEYSAEYSAKNRRIFGTEYSAKSADMPITENRVKMAVFDPFYLKIWSNFGHTFFANSYFKLALYFTFQLSYNDCSFAITFATTFVPYLWQSLFSSFT